MDSLCHSWFTTTNLSYRFPISKLPPLPPPCAVLLVIRIVAYICPSFCNDFPSKYISKATTDSTSFDQKCTCQHASSILCWRTDTPAAGQCCNPWRTWMIASLLQASNPAKRHSVLNCLCRRRSTQQQAAHLFGKPRYPKAALPVAWPHLLAFALNGPLVPEWRQKHTDSNLLWRHQSSKRAALHHGGWYRQPSLWEGCCCLPPASMVLRWVRRLELQRLGHSMFRPGPKSNCVFHSHASNQEPETKLPETGLVHQ